MNARQMSRSERIENELAMLCRPEVYEKLSKVPFGAGALGMEITIRIKSARNLDNYRRYGFLIRPTGSGNRKN